MAAGVGAGLARGLLAADALRAGQLVTLTEVAIPTHYNLYAVWPQGKRERVAHVVETLKALVAQSLE
jgi:LysR family glycine cleavage system transcriptional activator